VAKPELGNKHQCQNCGARFFDLNKNPITCPKCGTVFQGTPLSRAAQRAAAADEDEPDPIAGAELDCWQADPTGLYDSQKEDSDHLHMRGIYTTDAEGRYLIRTSRPVHYQIPSDGPVGDMLKATGRHPWRPAHVHFMVSAEGYYPVTTHLFDPVDPYLDSDAVFGVKDSLITEFELHETRDRDAERLGMTPPFCTAHYDFVLSPKR